MPTPNPGPLSGARPRCTRLDMELTAHPRSLSLIRRILCTCAPPQSLSHQVLNDIQLAVTEACTNVIKHAFHHDPTRKYGLQVQVTADRYLIQVIYHDPTFDPATIPVPDLQQAREGGLGVFLIRHIMDEVEYLVDAATGTVTLRMVKFLAAPDDPGGQGENRNPSR